MLLCPTANPYSCVMRTVLVKAEEKAVTKQRMFTCTVVTESTYSGSSSLWYFIMMVRSECMMIDVTDGLYFYITVATIEQRLT